MNIKLKIEEFIENNNVITITDYTKTLHENLKELNSKEEKYNQWLLLMVLIFFILSNSSIDSISLGPLSLKDISIIGKILPLIFIFVLFNLKTITSQKNDTINALKILAQNQFAQKNFIELERGEISLITRLFIPHSFTISIIKSFNKKFTNIEALIGFPLLIPLILIALTPYIIIVMMLVDSYNNL